MERTMSDITEEPKKKNRSKKTGGKIAPTKKIHIVKGKVRETECKKPRKEPAEGPCKGKGGNPNGGHVGKKTGKKKVREGEHGTVRRWQRKPSEKN